MSPDQSGASSKRARTAEHLKSIVLEDLAFKSFEAVRIGEIADRARIARCTFYRHWSSVEQVVLETAKPSLVAFLEAALRGEAESARQALAQIWRQPGLSRALSHPDVACASKRLLIDLITAATSRKMPGRDPRALALVIAGAIQSFMTEFATGEVPTTESVSELVYTIYVAAFLTPQAWRAAVRGEAERAGAGRFPPAVSVRESLASDDYLISMIDGRPYRSLRRHLRRFGMSPDDYRRCFNLDPDYPMVARSYSELRRELACVLPNNRPRAELQAA